MPEKANADAKHWRTVKLPNGKSVRIAIVKKTAPKPAHKGARPVGGTVENIRTTMKKKGK